MEGTMSGLPVLAYLLIVTAVYTGSFTSGVKSKVTFEVEAHSALQCQQLERDMIDNLDWLGATDIRAEGCPER
jgi:hypothetical protein